MSDKMYKLEKLYEKSKAETCDKNFVKVNNNQMNLLSKILLYYAF